MPHNDINYDFILRVGAKDMPKSLRILTKMCNLLRLLFILKLRKLVDGTRFRGLALYTVLLSKHLWTSSFLQNFLVKSKKYNKEPLSDYETLYVCLV